MVTKAGRRHDESEGIRAVGALQVSSRSVGICAQLRPGCNADEGGSEMEGRSGREKMRGMKQIKKKSEVVWPRGEKVEASEVKDGVGLESL